jgi:hypothetical protein
VHILLFFSTSFSVLNIIAHHKTGTIAGMGLLIELCCSNEEIKELMNEPHWFILKNCSRTCKNVKFHEHGLPNWTAKLGDIYVHLIRHPFDIVASGYLYHKACNEPFWTNDSLSSINGNILPGLKTLHLKRETYCSYLQRVDPTIGISYQVNRTFHAMDGLGRMLFDMKALSRHPMVLNLCLSKISEEEKRVINFTKSWNKHNKKSLSYLQVDRHKTDHNEAKLLYPLVIDSVRFKFQQMNLLSVLETFPCAPEHFIGLEAFTGF